ncbi:MAG: hypothetical protein ACI83B_001582 [Sediminicola sp.]|jgi:hypothetical protein
MVEEDKLQLLRDILLIDDRQVTHAFHQQIKTIKKRNLKLTMITSL